MTGYVFTNTQSPCHLLTPAQQRRRSDLRRQRARPSTEVAQSIRQQCVDILRKTNKLNTEISYILDLTERL